MLASVPVTLVRTLVIRSPVLLLLWLWSPIYSSSLVVNESKRIRYRESDCVLQVKNLDWTTPRDQVSKLLRDVVGNEPDIVIRDLPKVKRKRDEGKFHNGSAKIFFSNADLADAGLVKLKSGEHTNNISVRRAWVLKEEFKEKTKDLTQEQILYRKERAAAYARRRERAARETDELLAMLPLVGETAILPLAPLEWSLCPKEYDPSSGGKLSSLRMKRKRVTVEAFVQVLSHVFRGPSSETNVYDFGCGTGNLLLPLVWWLQRQGFERLHGVGVDTNDHSLELLRDRCLVGDNISTMNKDVEDLDVLDAVNSIVVSLHLCGIYSDVAIRVAVENNVPFVISPCCIGKVKIAWSRGSTDMSYPRSSWLRSSLPDINKYGMIAKAADYSFTRSKEGQFGEVERRERCHKAKRLVEMDRLRRSVEDGQYTTHLVEIGGLDPDYSKREILIGVPAGHPSADRLSQLLSGKSMLR